jgi:hypothetical protein
MKQMVLPLVALVLIAPLVSAAPAPDRAKEKLAAMKKKLPEAAQKWIEGWNAFPNHQVEVKLVRQISPTEAKVTLLLPYFDNQGVAFPNRDEMLTIHLRYYDGTWTTTGCQTSRSGLDSKECAVQKLMLAIDELGEK